MKAPATLFYTVLAAILAAPIASAAEYTERHFAAEGPDRVEACERAREMARRDADSLWVLDHLGNCKCPSEADEGQAQRCEISARFRTSN